MRARRLGIVAATAALLAGVPAPAGAAPTTPAPAADPPGSASTYWNVLGVYYRGAADNHLHARFGGGPGGGWDAPVDYGGVLTSGVGAITVGAEFARTWMFVRGTPGTVYFRAFSDAVPTVGPWTNLGGPATSPPVQGTPSPSCAGDFTANPTVYVRGGDGALWRRTLGASGSWQSAGGVLTTDPAAVPATEGFCPTAQDVFAAGAGGAIYEWAGRWYPAVPDTAVRTDSAPAALRFSDGGTWLFYRARTTNHLMRITRRPGQPWSAPLDLGGDLAAAPTATFHDGAARVLMRLSDGNLHQGVFTGGGFIRWQIP